MTSELAPLIMVVDDFEDNRAMYSEFLAHAGYRVVEATDGIEAVERTRDLLPDVVIMDLSLPRMDGWGATRQLKADPRTRAIPVIALTGHGHRLHEQGALDAGCDRFLAKPCLPAKLLHHVREVLARRGDRAEAVAHGEVSPAPRKAGGRDKAK